MVLLQGTPSLATRGSGLARLRRHPRPTRASERRPRATLG